MSFEAFLQTAAFALSEGSVYERLRRHPGVQFDPYLFHATLIYDPSDANMLEQVHREYLDVGQRYGLPMFILTDTWRANQERIQQSRYHNRTVNQDNVRFLDQMRASYSPSTAPIFIGGQIGPRGDAYAPAEALSALEAERFHAPQLEALAAGGVDFLYASTLPALSEARGIATAMSRLALPFVLSFIIRRDGTLLDGTPLGQAVDIIDQTNPRPPTGYAVNCVHPTVFSSGLAALEKLHPSSIPRFVSFQANTSRRDPEELDGLDELETEEPETLAASILAAHQQFGTLFVGGCCGTSTAHIESLARAHQTWLQ